MSLLSPWHLSVGALPRRQLLNSRGDLSLISQWFEDEMGKIPQSPLIP